MKIILDYFKVLNDSHHLKVVMIDKDLKEELVIKETFPNVQALYCNWHNQNTFKKRFKNYSFELVMKAADSEQEFEKMVSEFLSSEQNNSGLVEYFKNNWLNCVDKWAKFKRYGLPLNLQETNNPVEVLNKQIKAYSTKHFSSSLSKCLSYILEYIKTSELNKLYINTVQVNKKRTSKVYQILNFKQFNYFINIYHFQ